MALRRKPLRSGSRSGSDGPRKPARGEPKRYSSFKPKSPKAAEAQSKPKPKGGREVDARKTRAALQKLRRAVEQSEQRAGEGSDAARLSEWEREFAGSVDKKLATYGSAFRDPSKGRLEEPLSARQAQKLREIGRKAAGKGGGGLKRSGPIRPKAPPKRSGRVRDIAEEERDAPPPAPGKTRR